jgi:ankyrin repeat protein
MNTDKFKVAVIVFVLALCFYAARRGNDWYEANYEYPLATVISVGNTDEVERLVGMGANIEGPGDGEPTPIHLAAKHGQTKIAEFLLAKGARLDVRDEDGWSPLHAAVQNEHTETVALLLDWGIDPNVADKSGWTPLHVAATQGLYDIVSLLLGHGARTGVPASLAGEVRTPIFRAASNFSNVDKSQKVIDLLLEHGAQMTIWEEVMMGKAAELRVRLEGDPKLAVTPDHWGSMPLRYGAVGSVRVSR